MGDCAVDYLRKYGIKYHVKTKDKKTRTMRFGVCLLLFSNKEMYLADFQGLLSEIVYN